MKRAIHFGAGKIGRGFIGALLSQTGYEVCFAEANPQLVDEINRRRGYTVHVTDEICAELRIAGVSAVRADSGEAVRRLVDADLVTTAVGLGVLPRVAPVIAAGLRARKAAGVAAPLNVDACENGERATSRLKASVYEALDAPTAAWAERTVGFADCSVDRIVPPVAFPEPLDVAAEAFHEWNVERSAWVGEPPQLSGMHLTDELEAHIERKLFTLNTGHCATAYLGHLKGYVTIAEALADERIFGLVRGAMRQSGEALIRNILLGDEVCQSVGGKLNAGYVPDNFGHISQLPQILNGVGFDTAFFFRGMDRTEYMEKEFYCESPDVSRVLCEYMILGYWSLKSWGKMGKTAAEHFYDAYRT